MSSYDEILAKIKASTTIKSADDSLLEKYRSYDDHIIENLLKMAEADPPQLRNPHKMRTAFQVAEERGLRKAGSKDLAKTSS